MKFENQKISGAWATYSAPRFGFFARELTGALLF